MRTRPKSGRGLNRLLSLLLLLLVVGVSIADAQAREWIMHGRAKYYDADFDSAIVCLKKALIYPMEWKDSAVVYSFLGACYDKQGSPEKRDEYFGRILQRNDEEKLIAELDEFAANFERVRASLKKEGTPMPVDTIRQTPIRETSPVVTPSPVPEPVVRWRTVQVEPRAGDYLAGASAGAILGLASYFASVHFDNMAVDNVKAHTIAGDSTDAAEWKSAASRNRTLGDVFYYSSYPLIAVGFYAGLKLSQRIFPEYSSLMDENNPTRVYCSLDKDLNLSLGLRRSIW